MSVNDPVIETFFASMSQRGGFLQHEHGFYAQNHIHFGTSLRGGMVSYWSFQTDSNRQPADYKSATLPLSHESGLQYYYSQ